MKPRSSVTEQARVKREDMMRGNRAYGGGGPAEFPLALERGNVREFLAMPMVLMPFVIAKGKVGIWLCGVHKLVQLIRSDYPAP